MISNILHPCPLLCYKYWTFEVTVSSFLTINFLCSDFVRDILFFCVCAVWTCRYQIRFQLVLFWPSFSVIVIAKVLFFRIPNYSDMSKYFSYTTPIQGNSCHICIGYYMLNLIIRQLCYYFSNNKFFLDSYLSVIFCCN